MIKAAPEWVVAGVLLVITLNFRWILHAPLQLPSISQFSVMGEIFLIPMLGLCLWVLLPILLNPKGDPELVRKLGRQAGDALCFGLVLTLHFQIKLWIPLLRSTTYDSIYEATDRFFFSWLNPLIAWRSRWPQNHWIDGLYFEVFFWIFLVSFIAHNQRSRSEFRRVFLAVLLMFALGANLYLVAPALGPFLYHPSANALIGDVQRYMYGIRKSELAGGVIWLRANSGRYLTCGLAAMPSLHAAGSFIFLYYAWRYVRPLAWVYGPIFIWILFAAMASRWHYGIDLVAGIALACGCIALSDWWMSAHEAAARRALQDAEQPVIDESLPEDMTVTAR
ncbi:MAG TPA: phosphatase PAP2 family protein [Acidobacteriaceae bacterium]|nr:phosphatase PAP2 family protein [Acidobacteriaceae bacterium]